jgi:hypothetical protein
MNGNDGLEIFWSNDNLESMTLAQIQINESIFAGNFELVKNKLISLQTDLQNFYTQRCNVCGDGFSSILNSGTEIISVTHDWGRWSTYDRQRHKISLCSECYDEFIMKGPLGKHIKISKYM